MEIPELEKGWLAKQVEATLKEVESWPNWMKREINLGVEMVSTRCNEK